jgi:hypothetical protein
MALRIGTALVAASAGGALWTTAAHAQLPYIVGTWKLDITASKLPGPAPRMHIRRYSLAPDGTLVGLAVVVDASGRPDFLQFAAKSDGKDYDEFNSRFLAALQIDGTKTPRQYTETPIDSRTVAWADKYDGKVVASGKKWVSEDGRTLTFTSTSADPKAAGVEYRFVFDRQ